MMGTPIFLLIRCLGIYLTGISSHHKQDGTTYYKLQGGDIKVKSYNSFDLLIMI